jgi:solute carrier family 34 (sodium-dependent phosphate cotransporter)
VSILRRSRTLEYHVSMGNEPHIDRQAETEALPGSGNGAAEARQPASPTGPPVRVEERSRRLRTGVKVLSFLAALFLFILAIQLMKDGAGSIAPRLQGTFPVDNMVSTLGLGWLGAYLVLSGSPVAAASLTLFAAGATNELQTFTMLTGSRLGASFIVLLVGFLYAIRSRNRRESIGMGVLALSMTALVYVPGMLLGYGLLKAGVLSGIRWHASAEITTAIDAVWGPFVGLAGDVLPGPFLFPLGLAVILASFKLLDQVLPSLDGERHAEARAHWFKRPWPMFGLGCLAALLTLSVSVALTVLVPLASRGYIERREAIPYIAGANITTLADTLVAAMILGNPLGVQVVLAEAIGVAAVTLVILAFLYRPLSRGILALDEWIVATTPRLVLFVAGLFLLPVGLLFSGRLL